MYILHNRNSWVETDHNILVCNRVSYLYIIQSRSIQRFLLWKPCSYIEWKPCGIHVVRPVSQVMYSYCLLNAMAGKPIEVETIMTIWSCYISTCTLPYEAGIFLLGLT
jgi:hypothetical protein